MQPFDPIAMEVFSNRLLTITEEMGITLVRGSFSPNIKERQDCSVALFDYKGRLISQASHIPMHLGALEGGVRTILRRYEIDAIDDGDVFMCNDAYLAGGTHSPDITLVTPIFWEGQLRFFATNLGHHSDVGGSTPGSVSPTARTIYDEGLRIPLVKVMRAGQLESDILDMVTSNSREPEDRSFDLKVQIAANERGRRLVLALLENHGLEQVEKSIEDVLTYTERRLRNRIAALGDGTSTYTTYLDDDGFGGEPVAIVVTLTVDGESLTVDFEGYRPPSKRRLQHARGRAQCNSILLCKNHAGPGTHAQRGYVGCDHYNGPEGHPRQPGVSRSHWHALMHSTTILRRNNRCVQRTPTRAEADGCRQ